jgi:hypothetical protein
MRVVLNSAAIAPEKCRIRRAPIFAHRHQRRTVSIGRDAEDLHSRPSTLERLAYRGSNRLPPEVRILLDRTIRWIICGPTRSTRQRKRAPSVHIEDEDLDGGAAEIDGEQHAALSIHGAASARMVRRLSADRRCGRC